MSKYDKLWKYIKSKKPAVMTYEEIEKVAGVALDHSFLKYKKELEEYGFKVEKISMKDKIVRFVNLKS